LKYARRIDFRRIELNVDLAEVVKILSSEGYGAPNGRSRSSDEDLKDVGYRLGNGQSSYLLEGKLVW
jgi:hypothetical protein